MHNLPDAFLSHKTSSRVRLKILSKKGDITYFTLLRDELSKYSFIEKIEANPLTGSVLLIYKGDLDLLLKTAESNNIFRLKEFKTNSTELHQRVSSTFRDINNQIKRVTGGGLDLGSIAFLSLLGAGIYQISRGNFTTPAWYTAFWYAMNIFLISKNDKGT